MAEVSSKQEEIITRLFEIEAIKFGDFKLKSGIQSPIYFNLRVIIGYPKLLRTISELLYETCKTGGTYHVVCGVPYTALPLATCMSLDHDIPMVIRRREAKDYGTKQMIEGVYKEGQLCLIVEDVVTTGSSVLETAKELKHVGVDVTDAVVLLDRGQGGKAMLLNNGITLHTVLNIHQVLDVLLRLNKIDALVFNQVHQFISTNQFQPLPKPPSDEKKASVLSYKKRMELTSNSVARHIFDIMDRKETNLCFSADVTSCAELLKLADTVGPHICMLKTHVDILTDFTTEFVTSLKLLAKKHDFLIFEDRKFADIGNTVKNQYSQGMYKINEWADIVNAHSVPGEGVVQGLKEASDLDKNACLMLAQMSSKGALTTGEYTKTTVDMAKKADDFVIGFISTSAVCDDPKFLHMTPGVNLSSKGDTLGQVYLTPEEVIKNRHCDVIIVGRGIYRADNPQEAAVAYKEAGYQAYKDLMQIA